MRYLLSICLFVFGNLCISAQSPIASGFWVKVKISREGVYRVNYQDLKNAGFNVSTLDPRKIQLRGHQGAMLPESNLNRQTGLPEIPIWIEGESDGIFNPSDFILFYGGITTKWILTNGNSWTHVGHDYENTSWLYLGVSNVNGMRVKTLPEASQPVVQVVTKTDYVFSHDSDMVNPVAMGRTWLGEKMGNETLKRSFLYTLPALSDDSAFVNIGYASAMFDGNGTFITTINGFKKTYSCNPINTDAQEFDLGNGRNSYPTNGGSLNIGLELVRPNSKCAAWLNYIEINCARKIRVDDQPIIIRNKVLYNHKPSRIDMEGNFNLRVWGISNEKNPTEYLVRSEPTVKEYFQTDSATKDFSFVAFNADKCYPVVFDGKIANADIIAGNPIQFLIISHPDFIEAAEKLATFRKLNDGYSTKVVTPQSIFNAYNCGMQDIVAIRDYIRDEYNKSKSKGTELGYVLLIGASSYDFKNRIVANTNKIPIYEDYSYYKTSTFCLDDFYGYLDSNMGRPAIDPNKLGLSIGRIPARTKVDANAMVEKLIRYYSPKSLGPWRSELTFVCDDVDNNWEKLFVAESEQYASAIAAVHPDLQVNKIYADAYKQVSNGNTEQYPEVTSAITKSINSGSLFLNYQGHGGEKGWAQEEILTVPTINGWKNTWNMPVLFTATCEFGRYDNPALVSGGELALLNPDGGAVALMTTTRLVYVSGNSQINSDFWTNYGFPKPNEPVPTIGDLFKRMKNRPTITSEDNKFALLGDPSMRLAFPVHSVVIDSINGKTEGSFVDTLKAFSIVRMKGHIHERLGSKFSTFNGQLWVKVLDKPTTKYTLDNDKVNAKLAFKDQTSTIYKGIVSVSNGDFSIVFSIPKDIAYNVGLGKILLYAHNGATDASGAKNLLIGSSELNYAPDFTGPLVKLFMNDTTFKFGAEVLSNAVFLAQIKDLSGINATGAGIGRDMVVVLDKGSAQEKSYILNEFFSYDLNSYTSGKVSFPMQGLAVGKHQLTFKIWDIHNNSAEGTLEFVVADENELNVTYQNVFPNPFTSEVTLLFEHNKAGHNLQADLEIYNNSGMVQYKHKFELNQATSRESRVQWDGRSSGGAPFPNGFYMYQIFLKADDGSQTIVRGKMIKI